MMKFNDQDRQCHPERSEGSRRPTRDLGARRIRSFAALRMTIPAPYGSPARIETQNERRVRVLFCAMRKKGRAPTIERKGASMSTENATQQHDEGAVLLDQRGPIATRTLARPAALNALTWAMYQQMEAHLERLAADDTTRAIILRGAGKAFAAGTDIQQFQGFTGESGIAYEHKMETIVERLYSITKPTIAAIDGYAVGAGLVIASVCDLRYATPASRFGVPIARTLGNCITLKNYRHLVDSCGAMRTKEMLFTGRLLTATDALQCGFFTAIVD